MSTAAQIASIAVSALLGTARTGASGMKSTDSGNSRYETLKLLRLRRTALRTATARPDCGWTPDGWNGRSASAALFRAQKCGPSSRYLVWRAGDSKARETHRRGRDRQLRDSDQLAARCA
jgi:hypothetical protein